MTTRWRLRTAAVAWGLAMTVSAQAAGAPAKPNEFDCMIEPAQVVDVRSPVVGILQQVHARRGQTIRKGDLLVTIESSVERSATDTARFRADAQGAIQLARSKVSATQEKSRRMQELHAEEIVSAQARDDAAAELKLAQSELKSAEENAQLAKLEHRQALDQLNRRVLRSPFDGVVVDTYLHPGALVDTGDQKKPILKIAQTHPLLVQSILPFRLFPQVRQITRATVMPEPPFATTYIAKVKAIDRVIDSAAGTFGIVFELDNIKQDLPAGLRCKVTLPGVM
jgi:RND family efflux transporter MFP subunit